MQKVRLFRKFSDKYIVPEKLDVAEYAEHLAQIKMHKEKKKEETEGECTVNGMAEPGVQ